MVSSTAQPDRSDRTIKTARDFLEKVQRVYQRATEKGMLREGLDPQEAARDTWAFTSGILHLLLGFKMDSEMQQQIPRMISTHMALRHR